MVVMVLGLEVLTNHIGIDYEGTMGSSIGSFDGMTYGGGPVGSLPENHFKRILMRRWWDQDVVHEY